MRMNANNHLLSVSKCLHNALMSFDGQLKLNWFKYSALSTANRPVGLRNTSSSSKSARRRVVNMLLSPV